jgi:hypothetical protein
MPPDGPPPADFRNVRLDGLRRAIDLYLAVAYPDGAIPEAVRKRLVWRDEAGADPDPDALLTRPPFEKVGRNPSGAPIVALRLGNVRYPNMKLQVQPWDAGQGFLLSVNTHDQVSGLDPKAPDASAFRALQAENQKIKEAIESAWDGAGLPTFNRYLRDYIAAHAAPGGAGAV